MIFPLFSFFFFFNDTATTEIYTLSLHDALPICYCSGCTSGASGVWRRRRGVGWSRSWSGSRRSEEHTSELQSPCNLVCRLLLEKKKKISINTCCLQISKSILCCIIYSCSTIQQQ